MGIPFYGGGSRYDEGRWCSQSHSGSLRGSWGWSSATGHCPGQAAPVRSELHFRAAGRVSLGPLGKGAGSNGGGGKLFVPPAPQSVSAPLPRMVSGGTERPVPGRRFAWTGKWGPGGASGHDSRASLSAPWPWELVFLRCFPWAAPLHPGSLWSWPHDPVVLLAPCTGEDRGIRWPRALR